MQSIAGQGPVTALVDQADQDGTARVRLTLTVPRAASTLPTVRALLDSALILVGATEDCRGELAVALTEACSNAIVHAQGSAGYTVGITVSGSICVVDVTDTGGGLDALPADGALPARLADRGRGLALMRRCTDSMELRQVRPRGLAIRMCKALSYAV